MDDTSLFPADTTQPGADAGAAGTPAAGTPAAAETPPGGQPNADATAAQPGSDAADPAKGAAAAEAKPGDKPADAKDGQPTGAPEKYEDFSAPEGFELNQQLLGEFTPMFQKWGLSQEHAQELLNAAPKLVNETAEKTAAAVLEAVGLADRSTWAQQVREDKAIGGEKTAENVAIARKGAEALFSAETKAFFAKTGLANHPALVRDMHRYGLTLTEDGSTRTAPTTNSTPQTFFAKSRMNP